MMVVAAVSRERDATGVPIFLAHVLVGIFIFNWPARNVSTLLHLVICLDLGKMNSVPGSTQTSTAEIHLYVHT